MDIRKVEYDDINWVEVSSNSIFMPMMNCACRNASDLVMALCACREGLDNGRRTTVSDDVILLGSRHS
jgi:hypothetical protein